MFCQKILLAYDGSEGAEFALEKTIELIKHIPSLTVHVVYVNRPPQLIAGDAYIAQPINMEPELDEELQLKLNLAETRISPFANCEVDIIVKENVEQALLEHIETLKSDLFIIGNRGLGGVKKIFLGSVSNYIVNHSPIPVLVVRHSD